MSSEHSARRVVGISALSCPPAPGEAENTCGRDREARKPKTHAQVASSRVQLPNYRWAFPGEPGLDPHCPGHRWTPWCFSLYFNLPNNSKPFFFFLTQKKRYYKCPFLAVLMLLNPFKHPFQTNPVQTRYSSISDISEGGSVHGRATQPPRCLAQ